MNPQLKELGAAYSQDKIVPFIGAGLSVPFSIPSWWDLIQNISNEYSIGKIKNLLQESVSWALEENDYWGAIDVIKKYARLEDQDIQKMIVKLIKERKQELTDELSHNYIDLSKMKFKLYLTTNYENLLYEYIRCDNIPIQLKDLDFSSQDLYDTTRICHLHGFTSNPGSIVISKSSYDSLYSNEKYGDILKTITGSKHLLFMGFSFDDKFVCNLIKDYKKHLQGVHYILLDNPSNERIQELRQEYGLITIAYDSSNSSHAIEIRKILNQIMEDPENVSPNDHVQTKNENQEVIIGAGLLDLKKNVSDNLFYKKLKLENIDDALIELSTLFYVASEQYIRLLKKTGISLDVIDVILGKVFIKYHERYVDTYKKFGDSEQFLNVVYESLESFDLGRYAELFEGKQSDENENRGLIHLLAEDETMNVWWGKERLNEQFSK